MHLKNNDVVSIAYEFDDIIKYAECDILLHSLFSLYASNRLITIKT